MKKEENDKSEPLPQWHNLKFDSRPIHGFDLDVFGPVSSPTATDADSRKWS